MNTKVVVRHFHEGNDADRAVRASALYATVARIIDLDTGEVVLSPHPDGHAPLISCEVWAFCSKRDVPSRAYGRSIAIGRLQKQFPDQCRDADFGVFEYLRVKPNGESK